jgi:hypothetical protein
MSCGATVLTTEVHVEMFMLFYTIALPIAEVLNHAGVPSLLRFVNAGGRCVSGVHLWLCRVRACVGWGGCGRELCLRVCVCPCCLPGERGRMSPMPSVLLAGCMLCALPCYPHVVPRNPVLRSTLCAPPGGWGGGGRWCRAHFKCVRARLCECVRACLPVFVCADADVCR